MAVFEAEKNGVLLTNDPSKVNLEDVCDLIEKQVSGPVPSTSHHQKGV